MDKAIFFDITITIQQEIVALDEFLQGVQVFRVFVFGKKEGLLPFRFIKGQKQSQAGQQQQNQQKVAMAHDSPLKNLSSNSAT